ncbi:MAG: AAA family ATPase [Candidatus Aenigmatarchaeota archaeon]
MKIFVVVGMPGSGKSFAADVIAKNFNGKVFRTGDVIRDEIKKRGLKYTPENDAKIAHWFHTRGRERLIIKRTWDKIKKSRKKIIVIEGCRAPEEIKLLEKYSKIKPIIIATKTNFNVRVKRIIKRKRFGKKESKKYLKNRDKLELSHGLGKIIKMANYVINNSKLTKRQTEKKLIKLIKGLL